MCERKREKKREGWVKERENAREHTVWRLASSAISLQGSPISKESSFHSVKLASGHSVSRDRRYFSSVRDRVAAPVCARTHACTYLFLSPRRYKVTYKYMYLYISLSWTREETRCRYRGARLMCRYKLRAIIYNNADDFSFFFFFFRISLISSRCHDFPRCSSSRAFVACSTCSECHT